MLRFEPTGSKRKCLTIAFRNRHVLAWVFTGSRVKFNPFANQIVKADELRQILAELDRLNGEKK